jgi:hypothetical protein
MTDIVERLKTVFRWVESRDLCVEELWLNRRQIEELNCSEEPGWDRINQRAVILAYLETKGGLYLGMLWCARVYGSELVPEDHVAVMPRGFEAKLIDRSGCQPF